MKKLLCLVSPRFIQGPQLWDRTAVTCAREAGGADEERYTDSFVANLPQCSWTELFYMQAKTRRIHTPVEGLGNAKWLAEMDHSDIHQAMEQGASRLFALRLKSDGTRFRSWAETAYGAIEDSFAKMESRELGIAFSASPVVELAAWHVLHRQTHRIVPLFHRLEEIDGIWFYENGQFSVAPHSAKTLATTGG